MKRIDSHKGTKSYQLAERLHSRWSTGAGPSISCMRDYPSELQFRVLEQAQPSPRASSFSNPSPFAPVRSRGTTLGEVLWFKNSRVFRSIYIYEANAHHVMK